MRRGRGGRLRGAMHRTRERSVRLGIQLQFWIATRLAHETIPRIYGLIPLERVAAHELAGGNKTYVVRERMGTQVLHFRVGGGGDADVGPGGEVLDISVSRTHEPWAARVPSARLGIHIHTIDTAWDNQTRL